MKPYTVALMAALCWGVAPIFEKWSLVKASPLTVLTVRSLVVSAMLVTVGVVTGQLRDLRQVDVPLFVLIALGGVLGGFIGLFIYFWALKHDLASTVVPVAGSYPLVTALLGILLLGEAPSAQRLVGVVLVVLGVVLIR